MCRPVRSSSTESLNRCHTLSSKSRTLPCSRQFTHDMADRVDTLHVQQEPQSRAAKTGAMILSSYSVAQWRSLERTQLSQRDVAAHPVTRLGFNQRGLL